MRRSTGGATGDPIPGSKKADEKQTCHSIHKTNNSGCIQLIHVGNHFSARLDDSNCRVFVDHIVTAQSFIELAIHLTCNNIRSISNSIMRRTCRHRN